MTFTNNDGIHENNTTANMDAEQSRAGEGVWKQSQDQTQGLLLSRDVFDLAGSETIKDLKT